MCVGSVGYYRTRAAAHRVRCLGMIVCWVRACFLLHRQRCITVLLQSDSRLQHMHRVLCSGRRDMPSIPALQLRPPRS